MITNEDRKQKIEVSKKIIQDEYEKLNILTRSCPHEFKLSDYETARCWICNKYGGWYCKDSKTNCCEYTSDDECCIHCGEPEERK